MNDTRCAVPSSLFSRTAYRRHPLPHRVTGVLHRLGHVLACITIIAWCGWAACADSGLSAITPSISAPPIDLLSTDTTQLPEMRLLGIDLEQGGTLIAPNPVVLDGNKPLIVRMYWISDVAPVTAPRTGTLRFWAHQCIMARTIEFDAGPERGSAAWSPGSVYRGEVQIDLPNIAATLNGAGSLTLSLSPGAGAGRAARPLLYLPLHITPFIGHRSVDPRRVDAALGSSYHDLSVSFRLGHEAEQRLAIPEGVRNNVAELALVSGFSYGTLEQGAPAFDVIARSTSGATFTWIARSGETTARIDYDYYAPGTLTHEKIAIVESWDANYSNILGLPFEKHKYIARFALPMDFGPLESLTFHSRNPYFVDIFNVVLIPVDLAE